MFNSIAIFILSVIIACGMFFNYKEKLPMKWKVTFVIIIVLSNIALLKQSKENQR